MMFLGDADPETNKFKGDLVTSYDVKTDIHDFEKRNGFMMSNDPDNEIPDTFEFTTPIKEMLKWKDEHNKMGEALQGLHIFSE